MRPVSESITATVLSADAVAMSVESQEKSSDVIGNLCGRKAPTEVMSLSIVQRMISDAQEAIVRPSGLNFTSLTAPEWPVRRIARLERTVAEE